MSACITLLAVTDDSQESVSYSRDNDNVKYWRTLFFQFWPGGVATHLQSYRHDSPEAKANQFGCVTVLTADYGENKFVLSDRFEVERDEWYRMYFQYNPDVRAGRMPR